MQKNDMQKNDMQKNDMQKNDMQKSMKGNLTTKTKKVFMGIDTGSVSINTVLISENGEYLAGDYRRTNGRIISSVKDAFRWFKERFPEDTELAGVGVTGSARRLTAALCRADLVKNEITAHTAAVLECCPDVKTLLEIGGEDSKIVIIREGVPVDFAMNTLCAAGTGAFMDQLAGRLGIPVEELGDMALNAKNEAAISGRCTVFAESDIIFKQQSGTPLPDIIKGLCRSMVRNYLSDTGQGKPLEPPFVFQGGVAANAGIVRAFSEELESEIIIPEHFSVMGAKGIALLVREEMIKNKRKSRVKPISEILDGNFLTESFTCDHCGNGCEIVRFMEIEKAKGKTEEFKTVAGKTETDTTGKNKNSANIIPVASWGGRCERWDGTGSDLKISAGC